VRFVCHVTSLVYSLCPRYESCVRVRD
jgi:hypothetical protein